LIKIFPRKKVKLIDKEQPDLFNQAVMEFGALHCTPQNPNCEECVFNRACVARRQSMQTLLPVKIRKQKVRKRHFTYIIIEHRGKLLMRKRGAGDIWNGLYDFFLIENKKPMRVNSILNEISELKGVGIESESKIYKHILSHQQLLTRFLWIKIPQSSKIKPLMKQHQLEFHTREEIAHLPKPILITRYLQESNYSE
jgi:A/G-specific adenine glycosylase